MSHILFGDFKSQLMENDIIKKLKNKLLLKNVLIWFNQDIDFYKDVNIMLDEHKGSGKISFCITTINQKYNSDDLLFPWNKYSNEELFPNGLKDNDRTYFNSACLANLKILHESVNDIKRILKPDLFRIFVSCGYDRDFKLVKCNIQNMINDIYTQMTKSGYFLDSVIYEIDDDEDEDMNNTRENTREQFCYEVNQGE